MGFESMWYSFMIILLLLNGSFVAMSFLPVTQDGSVTLAHTWGSDTVGDMNSLLNVFGGQIDRNMCITAIDSNALATTDSQQNIFAFKNLIFGGLNAIGGAIGVAFAVVSFFGQVLFGYFFWLDYLLNPLWHPLIGVMNLTLKSVFFLIEVVGLAAFARSFFQLI